jgi:uncharacterized metal-binding protein YceD (DUF177 family)
VSDTLDWTEKTTDIPAGGLEKNREATAEEQSRVAKALNLLDLPELTAHYRVVAIDGGGFRLKGTLDARVVQACVVSLEPVASRLQPAFEVEFWPGLKAEGSDEETSILGTTEVEPLEHGMIPVGRIVFETVSASLDPYPRAEGAAFDWQDPAESDVEKTSPFAALSKLKNER